MNEVKVKDVIDHIKNKILKIVLLSFLFSSIAAIYSLNVQKIFESEALLSMSADSNNGNSSANNFSGIAKFAGIDLNQESKKYSPEYVKAILTSRDFFKHIAQLNGVLEGIVAHNGFNKETKEMIFDSNAYDFKNKSLKRNIINFSNSHKIFLANLNISIDKKTNYIFISYRNSSPYFSEKILNLIFQELNKKTMQKDSEQIKKELDYLKKIHSENNISVIRSSLSSLISSRIQDQMLSSVNEDYLIEFIDRPSLSESRVYPQRTRMVLITFVLSLLFLSLASLFHKFVIKEGDY